jgi:hypothetical protein
MATRAPDTTRAPQQGGPRRPGSEAPAGERDTRPAPSDQSTGYPQPGDRQTLPCDRCSRPAPWWRCFWGERLCSRCGTEAVEAFDRDGWPRAPWEATPAPLAGVLGPQGIVHARGEQLGVPRSFAGLAEVARRLGLAEVWIHEAAHEALGWPADLGKVKRGEAVADPFFADLGGYETRGQVGLSAYGRWWRPRGHGLVVHAPGFVRGRGGRQVPFKGTEGPHELYWGVSAYEEATGGRWPWKGTGQITSDEWLRSRYVRKERLAPTEVAPPFAQGIAAEGDFQWTRPARPDERGWLVAYDVNAAYLAAAGGVALPTGPVEHRDLFPELDERLPGYWLFEPPPSYGGPGPAPWPARSPCWVTTPTAAYLADRWGLGPLEAWVWPERHQYLRPWYDELRRAREAVLPMGGPALNALKTIYKAGLGRLESDRRAGGAEAPLYQPYWGQAVTALARCNLHRRLRGLVGAEPVAIQVDCLYFIAPRSHPEAFAARAGIPLGDGPGAFKAKGRPVPAEPALELLAGGGLPLQILKGLDALLEGEGS